MVHEWFGRHWRATLSSILGSRCMACGAAGRGSLALCEACTAELPPNSPACAHCAVRLQGSSGASPLCGACIKRLPLYQVAFCAFRYAYPVDHLVRDLKYRNALAHARLLGELLGAQLKLRQTAWPDCFIPVPLSTQRYRERGYNQAIEIGRFVERVTAVRMRSDLVTRVRHTSEQASLSRKARRTNIRKAFRVEGDVPKHVAILDDVVTTGSTVNELARALARGGAVYIEVWAVARAAQP